MKNNISFKIPFSDYRASVYGCWIGKNIGGTLGGPYECLREELNVKGFTTKPGEPLPNDDLDLQLAWLYNLERLGSQAIDAKALGEIWVNLITPYWNEYGIAKANMKRGLPPPLSGDYHNDWKNSNGAWIRTEIWACLAPACPDIAAKYALEDARVDHGAGEGTFAAIFVAAMQSAAFAVKDVRRCIEIALSTIPESSRVADSVREVFACYDKGMGFSETRKHILDRNSDIGDGWFEAPSNVAYAVIGLLFGEGDFKKSLLYAVNCGDDTDCTAATVGATLGILYGDDGIPEDWKAYIGDKIITISVKADGAGLKIPKTCSELSERIINEAPKLLLDNKAYVEISKEAKALPENAEEIIVDNVKFIETSKKIKPYTISASCTEFSAEITLADAPDVKPCEEKKLTLTLENAYSINEDCPHNITFRWWLADGFSVSGPQTAFLLHRNAHNDGIVSVEFTLKAGEKLAPANKCVLEISSEGRYTALYMPIVFLA